MGYDPKLPHHLRYTQGQNSELESAGQARGAGLPHFMQSAGL